MNVFEFTHYVVECDDINCVVDFNPRQAILSMVSPFCVNEMTEALTKFAWSLPESVEGITPEELISILREVKFDASEDALNMLLLAQVNFYMSLMAQYVLVKYEFELQELAFIFRNLCAKYHGVFELCSLRITISPRVLMQVAGVDSDEEDDLTLRPMQETNKVFPEPSYSCETSTTKNETWMPSRKTYYNADGAVEVRYKIGGVGGNSLIEVTTGVVTSLYNTITESLSGIWKGLQDFLTGMKAVKALGTGIKWITEKLPVIMNITSSVVMLGALMSETVDYTRTQMSSLLGLFINSVFPGGLVGAAQIIFERCKGLIQAGGEGDDALPSLFSLATGGILSTITTTTKWLTWSNVVKCSVGINAVMRAGQTLASVDWSQLLPSCLRKWMGIACYASPTELCSSRYWMVVEAYKDFVQNPKTAGRFYSIYQDYADVLKKNQKMLPGVDRKNHAEFLMKLATVMRSVEQSVGSVDTGRKKPFWIHVFGKPGTGKSKVTYSYLMRDVVQNFYPEFSNQVSSAIYNRSADPFWSGYMGQPICFLEDFLAYSAREDPTILEILPLVSCVPHQLNMPSVDNPMIGVKGDFFTSEMLVSTSNCASCDHINEIVDKGAWNRRRDIVAEFVLVNDRGNPCEPKDSGLMGENNELNFALVKQRYSNMDARELEATKPHLRVRIYNNQAVRYCDRATTLTYTQFVRYVINSIRAHIAKAEREITVSVTDHERLQFENYSTNRSPGTNTTLAAGGKPKGIESKKCSQTDCECGKNIEPCLLISPEKKVVGAQNLANMLLENVEDEEKPLECLPTPEDIVMDHFQGSLWKKGMMLTGILGIIGTGLACYKHFTQEPKKEDIELIGGKYTKDKARTSRSKAFLHNELRQISGDTQRPLLLNVVARSMGLLQVESEYKGSVLFVGGQMGICPAHFFHDKGKIIEDGVSMKIFMAGTTKPFEFRFEVKRLKLKYSNSGLIDVCAYEFDTAPKKNLMHFLPKREDIRDFSSTKGHVFGYRLFKNSVAATFCLHDVLDVVLDEGITYENEGTTYDYTERFVFPETEFERGDCGKLLGFTDNQNCLFFGMLHSVGAGAGYAQPLTRELVHDLCGLVQTAGEFVHIEADPVFHTDMGACQVVGSMPKEHRIRISEKTQLRPSPFFEKLQDFTPSLKEPSVISPSDPRCPPGFTPLRKVSKYAKVTVPVRRDLAKFSTRVMKRMLMSRPSDLRRKLTEEEAINGIPGVENLEPLPMSTSPGFPWVVTRPKGVTGKGYLFENYTKMIKGTKYEFKKVKEGKLRKRLDLLEEAIRNNKLILGEYWIDYVKDEKLELRKTTHCPEKGMEVKPRIFSSQGVQMQIVDKKYFGTFAKHCIDNYRFFPPKIGVDVTSTDWDMMLTELADRGGDYGFDCDVKEFDASTEASEAQECLEAINEYYKQCTTDWNEVDDQARKILLNHYSFGYHIAADMVYTRNGKTPSGHDLTALLNSWLLYRYVVQAIKNKYPDITADEVIECFGIATYGDDLMVLSGKHEYFLTGIEFHDYMKTLNVRVTPGCKTNDFGPNVHINELNFLKRNSRVHRSIRVSYLDITSINGMVNWIRETPSLEKSESVFLSITDAQKEIWLRGDPGMYHRFVSAVAPVLTRVYKKSMLSEEELIERYIRPGYGNILDDYHSAQIEADDFFQCSETATSFGATIASRVSEVSGPTHTLPRVVKMKPRVPMASKAVDYTTIASKWYIVDTYQWNTTDVPLSTKLATLRVPDQLLTNQQFKQAFTNMAQFRCKEVELAAMINGTKFHIGQLVSNFAPCCTKDDAATVYPGTSPIMMTQLAHVFQSPQENGTAVMRIPFAHPENYIDTQGATDSTLRATLGTFTISVFNQLKASANSSTTLSVTLMARIIDAEFMNPRPLTLVGGNSSKGDTTIIENTYVYGGGGNTISHNTEGDEYDQEGGSTQLEATGGSRMDYPTQGGNPFKFFRNPTFNLNSVVGTGFFDKLSLYPREIAPTKKSDFGRPDDEMEYSYLCSKPCFVGSATWSTSDAAGTSLTSGLIAPAQFCINYRTQNPTNPTLIPAIPIVDYLCGLHNYCSWDEIEILFDVVASPFATGRLLFAPMYGTYDDTFTLATGDSQYFTQFSLEEGKREFKVALNFASNRNVIGCTTTTKEKMSIPRRKQFSIGSWGLFVQIPYTVGEGIPLSCDINIFVSVKKPRFYFWNPHSVALNPPTFVAQAREGIKETKVEPEKKTMREKIVQCAGDTDPASEGKSDNTSFQMPSTLAGLGSRDGEIDHLERVCSFRDCVKKFVINKSAGLYTVVNSSGTIPIDNLLYGVTPLRSITGLYAAWRGGFRWQVQSTADTVPDGGTTTPLGAIWFYDSQVIPTLLVTGHVGELQNQNVSAVIANNTRTTAFETSFTTQYNFLVNPILLDFESDGNMVNPVVTAPEREFANPGSVMHQIYNTHTERFVLWSAGADDFRTGLFLGTGLVNVYQTHADL